jgi:ribosomal protein S18 acetylase RimI-like enzyme
VELSSRVERATSDDLAQLAALRVEQEWYASEALLRAIRIWEHGQHFVLRAAALGMGAALDPMTIVAATSAIVAGPVAVIGNVITRPGLRGRGLGRAVMSATLAWLRESGARSVMLDATGAGQLLYQKLGFVARERSWIAYAALTSLDLTALQARAGAIPAQLRASDDLPVIAALDQAAFGGDRLELLRLVASASGHWLYTAGGAGEPDGYLLVRALEPPRMGVRLGPWVAKTAEAGAALLAAAVHPGAHWQAPIARNSELQLSFSTSAASAEALALFRSIGGTLELDDVVMRLDLDGDTSDKPGLQSAATRPIADHPEWLYSWLAAMTF